MEFGGDEETNIISFNNNTERLKDSSQANCTLPLPNGNQVVQIGERYREYNTYK